MIISKAIELLQLFKQDHADILDQDDFLAHDLGIEALKRTHECRKHPFSPFYGPLPGESMPERGIR